jgi:hypothetical protein
MPRKLKYAKLTEYLRMRAKEGLRTLTLSFAEIDDLVRDERGGLPKSAYNPKYPWWSNNDENGRRSQAKAWKDAGYNAFPDHDKQTVTFAKIT